MNPVHVSAECISGDVAIDLGYIMDIEPDFRIMGESLIGKVG